MKPVTTSENKSSSKSLVFETLSKMCQVKPSPVFYFFPSLLYRRVLNPQVFETVVLPFCSKLVVGTYGNKEVALNFENSLNIIQGMQPVTPVSVAVAAVASTASEDDKGGARPKIENAVAGSEQSAEQAQGMPISNRSSQLV